MRTMKKRKERRTDGSSGMHRRWGTAKTRKRKTGQGGGWVEQNKNRYRWIDEGGGQEGTNKGKDC